MSSFKTQLLNKIYFSENKFLLRLYSFYAFRLRPFEENDAFINQDLKVLFIHNPKVAGNSLKNILNLSPASTWHQPPTLFIPPGVWEKYYSIVAVRHPIDRFISAYHYHNKASYQGIYLKKYPDLHQLELQKYFEILKKEPQILPPQVNYTRHLLSDKPIDMIIRYENLLEDVKKLFKKLNLSLDTLPHLNATKRPQKSNYFEDKPSFKDEVINYYQEDFEAFGYHF